MINVSMPVSEQSKLSDKERVDKAFAESGRNPDEAVALSNLNRRA